MSFTNPKHKYRIEKGRFGPEMVLEGPWSDSLLPLFENKKFAGIWINYACGFEGDDIEFVQRIPNLKSILIIVYHFSDLSPLNSNRDLQGIVIGCRKYQGVDFTNFPKLEHVGTEWQPACKTLLKSSTLRHLHIGKYPHNDLQMLQNLSALETLQLATSPVKSIEGIQALGSLRRLGLYGLTKLTDISALRMRPELTLLNIENCRRLGNIDAVSNLTHLRRLQVSACGDIASLKPISELHELVDVVFRDSNIVDGDLEPLKHLPKLAFSSFNDRRHYSHKFTDFPRTPGANIILQ